MHDEKDTTVALLTLSLIILGCVVLSALSWMQGAM